MDEKYKVDTDLFLRKLSEQISKYSLIQSLFGLKTYIKSKSKVKEPVFTYNNNQTMGYHVFPFIIDRFIRTCTNSKPELFLTNLLIDWVIDKYRNFSEMEESYKSKEHLRKRTYETLIRISYEQFGYQETNRTLVPRALYLYKEIPNSNTEKHSSFVNSINLVCEKLFRVDIEELLFGTFLITAEGDLKLYFKKHLTIDDSLKDKVPNPDTINIILEQFSISPEEYLKESYKRDSTSTAFIKNYPFVIFDFPIIRFRDFCVLPYPQLLLSRVTDRLDTAICEFDNSNREKGKYIDSFGEVFSEYIGLLLYDCSNKNRVYDLDKIPNYSRERADWLITSGKSVIIFECKSQRYKYSLKSTGNLDELDSFMSNRLRKPIKQLINTENQIRDDVINFPNIKSSFTCHKVIVVLENFHFANLLFDCLPDNREIRNLQKYNIHIISVLDLEVLLTSNFSRQIVDILESWFKNISEFPILRQYIFSKKNYKKDKNNILDHKLNKFFGTKNRNL